MRFLAALCFLSVCGFAQQDMGVITGVVTDASGAAVPGARVTAVNRETNESRSVETSDVGSYTVGPLRIGRYDLAIEKQGFKKSVQQNIELHAQDRARADMRLELGQIAESVSVNAEAPLLQSETSSLSKVVEQREIRALPLNGRNFQQLAWLSAGVAPATASRDRESGFNAHGQPMTQNTFLIDGIDNNNNVMGMQDRKLQVVIPSLDAVAEFKVQTSNFSAEFGRNSGAVMVVSIKSGGNRFRGTAYEYVRNDVFDSRDMFNYVDRNGDGKADPAALRQNQFGATLGGPIVRNKTFFFGSWEGRRERYQQGDLAVVPTADERNGLFSRSLAVINDPLTRQPFANNQFRAPASMLQPSKSASCGLNRTSPVRARATTSSAIRRGVLIATTGTTVSTTIFPKRTNSSCASVSRGTKASAILYFPSRPAAVKAMNGPSTTILPAA